MKIHKQSAKNAGQRAAASRKIPSEYNFREDTRMNIKRFFPALLLLTAVCVSASGCAVQSGGDKTPAETAANSVTDKVQNNSAETYGIVTFSDISGAYTPDINPCNENFAMIEIDGNGTTVGNYIEYNFDVKEHYATRKSHNISDVSKLYIPKTCEGKLKDGDVMIAMLTSFSDTKTGSLGFTVNTRGDELVCIPLVNGAAAGNEENYPFVLWADGARGGNSTEIPEESTPRELAQRRADEYRKENDIKEITADMDIFDFMRAYALKYYEEVARALPDFKIQNGTSAEKAGEYFDGMKKAKELENGFKASMKQEAAEILKVNLCI